MQSPDCLGPGTDSPDYKEEVQGNFKGDRSVLDANYEDSHVDVCVSLKNPSRFHAVLHVTCISVERSLSPQYICILYNGNYSY